VARDWTFLSNHAHVLLAAATRPDALTDELATTVGITRRATLSILKDLEEAGYLTRTRVGRRTRYAITPHRPFRHPTAAHREVDELLDIFLPRPSNPDPR